MSDRHENRKYLRLKTSQVTHLRRSASSELLDLPQGNIGNISKGGVFIETESVLQVGTVVKFQLRLPNRMEPIQAVAVVRRIQPADPKGIGVQFLEIDEDELCSLNDYIDAYRREK